MVLNFLSFLFGMEPCPYGVVPSTFIVALPFPVKPLCKPLPTPNRHTQRHFFMEILNTVRLLVKTNHGKHQSIR